MEHVLSFFALNKSMTPPLFKHEPGSTSVFGSDGGGGKHNRDARLRRVSSGMAQVVLDSDSNTFKVVGYIFCVPIST